MKEIASYQPQEYKRWFHDGISFAIENIQKFAEDYKPEPKTYNLIDIICAAHDQNYPEGAERLRKNEND